MNTRKSNHTWWEYFLYVGSTCVFAFIGVVVVLIKLFDLLWRLLTWPLKRLFRFVVTLLFLGLLIAGALFYWYTRPVDLQGRTERIIIAKGDDLGTIATRLRNQGIIRARRALIIPAEWIGLDRKLTPGRYDFSGTVSLLSVIHKLESADFVRVKITIYEGAPIWKVAGAVARSLEIDSLEVWKTLQDSALIASLGLPYLEGHLYPSTYIVPWGTPPELVVREMVAAFRSVTDSLLSVADPSGLNRYDLLKLASIIQAETKLESEQPKVASVYRNRLKLRMRLDADPTVIYGLGGLSRPLLRAELKTATPYNTYMRYGLPPTPINSPGLPAIRAAVRPDTTNYLFFVADGSGGHRFSRTNDEHNAIRRELKRAQRLNKKI
jgi:UPF0755 protein